MSGILYRFDFASGKSYIGVTTRTLAQRMRRHIEDARTSAFSVHRAWRKHGAPRVSTLAIVENHVLAETERKAITAFGTLAPGGYNMTPGGDFVPTTIPEIAARVSQTLRGIKRSAETRAKMSAARLGVRPSAATRARMSVAQTGKKASAAKLAKMSALAKSEKNPMKQPDVAAKAAASKIGKKRPDMTGDLHWMKRPEIVAKVIASRRANGAPWHSEATKQKISETKRKIV